MLRGLSLIFVLVLGGPEQSDVAEPCGTSDRPRPSDCQENLVKYLQTKLGDRGSGGAGISICGTCNDLCRGGGTWPERTGDKKDCRWWLY